jgi:hypothetical protein
MLRQNPDLPNTEVDGEVVLMSSEAGLYYGLGGTAAAIWKAIGSGTTIGALCGALTARYAVDEAICRRDVTEFVESLVTRQIIGTVEA